MNVKHQTPKDALPAHDPPAPLGAIPPGQIAYERTDIDPRSITRIAIVLAVFTVAAAGASFGLFRLLAERAKGNDPPPPPLSRPAGGARAPEPRLQTAPVADLAAIQAEDRRLLGGYGWVDEAGGVARIPIDEAMAMYVGQAARSAAQSPSPVASASPSGAPAKPPSPTLSPSAQEGHR